MREHARASRTGQATGPAVSDVIQQEPVAAVDERCRVGRPAVVRTADGREAELAPAGDRAPQRPEQLRFPIKVAVDDTPVGEDDLGAQQGIAGQPVTSS